MESRAREATHTGGLDTKIPMKLAKTVGAPGFCIRWLESYSRVPITVPWIEPKEILPTVNAVTLTSI